MNGTLQHPDSDEITSKVVTDIGPFAILPMWVLQLDLDGTALRVYAALRSFANGSGDCFPRRNAIAERAGVSLASYKRAMIKLEGLRLVTRTARYRPDGGLAGYVFRVPTVPTEILTLGSTGEPPPAHCGAPPGSTGEPGYKEVNRPREQTKRTDQEKEEDADASSSSATPHGVPDVDQHADRNDHADRPPDRSPPRGKPEPQAKIKKQRGRSAGSNDQDRSDVDQLCHRLRDRIMSNGCKAPTITEQWRTQARLLLDKDRRPLDKALRLIDWCQDHHFWRSNIGSMATFRSQYDRLRLQALDEHAQRNGHGSANGRRSYEPFTSPTPEAYVAAAANGSIFT